MKQIMPRFLRWLGNLRVLSHSRERAKRFFVYYLMSKNDPAGLEILKRVARIRKETALGQGDLEAYEIVILATKTEKLEGDIAEVGVYNGASAKLMRETTKKTMHLFDTFEGLPDLHVEDSSGLQKGMFSAQFERVRAYLEPYPNINLYKGLFPGTTDPVRNNVFSFVHLDADLYESTRDGLEFFYPRLSKGGVIVCHDYPTCEGVVKALEEFFRDKPEIIVQPFGTRQGVVIKT